MPVADRLRKIPTFLWREKRLLVFPIILVAIVATATWTFLAPLERTRVLAPELSAPFDALSLWMIALLVLLFFLSLHHEFLYRQFVNVRRTEKDKTSFVRMAADTLRTPLTGLRWVTELLIGGDMGNLTDEQKQSIDHMNKAIGRVIGLVNELLDVMRMSGGIVQYHPVPTDVNRVVKDAITDFAAVAGAKHQVVGFGELSKDSVIDLDGPLIRHLLGSLMGNASHLAPVHSKIIVHAESTDTEMSIGITYTGEPIILKPVTSLETEGGAAGQIPGMVQENPESAESLNLTISWEILHAAHGRFWTRDTANPEYTLFVTIPRVFVET